MGYAKKGDPGDGSDCLKLHPDQFIKIPHWEFRFLEGDRQIDTVCLSPPCPLPSEDAGFPEPTGCPEGGGTPRQVLQDR